MSKKDKSLAEKLKSDVKVSFQSSKSKSQYEHMKERGVSIKFILFLVILALILDWVGYFET